MQKQIEWQQGKNKQDFPLLSFFVILLNLKNNVGYCLARHSLSDVESYLLTFFLITYSKKITCFVRSLFRG